MKSSAKRVLSVYLGAILICLAAGFGVFAQETRGTIVGNVVDGNGAAVPNATVTVKNAATNVSTNVTTGTDGSFTVPFLSAGRYNITVEAANFKKLSQNNLELQVSARLELNLTLEAGNITEVVTIESTNTALETVTATTGQVIDRRRISELPLSDGNPFSYRD
ncbi:MAG: carboxypeptidase regulatory-like domain-containing protein [Blastocatellia bacterium]|nr:carboxypeptidase regulatory-like domain-containing protein [Blastocatellia bacterium]